MVKNKIRLALVGLGKIARDQHLPALAGDERFDLCATVSPDLATCGVPSFADLDALIADGPKLDAVAICTPPGVRAELALRALGAGLHVLLEKPPGANTGEMARLHAAMKQAGTTLMTAWHSRENAAVDAARDWLAGREIWGGLVTWKEDVRVWHPGQDWLLEADGFGVFDPAINALSILTAILPDPLEVAEGELHVPANRGAPMEAAARLRCGGAEGATIACALSILHEGEQQWDIVIETDAGRLELRRGGTLLRIGGDLLVAEPDQEYPRIYDRFATLIAGRMSDFDYAPLGLVEGIASRAQRSVAPEFHF